MERFRPLSVEFISAIFKPLVSNQTDYDNLQAVKAKVSMQVKRYDRRVILDPIITNLNLYVLGQRISTEERTMLRHFELASPYIPGADELTHVYRENLSNLITDEFGDNISVLSIRYKLSEEHKEDLHTLFGDYISM